MKRGGWRTMTLALACTGVLVALLPSAATAQTDDSRPLCKVTPSVESAPEEFLYLGAGAGYLETYPNPLEDGSGGEPYGVTHHSFFDGTCLLIATGVAVPFVIDVELTFERFTHGGPWQALNSEPLTCHAVATPIAEVVWVAHLEAKSSNCENWGAYTANEWLWPSTYRLRMSFHVHGGPITMAEEILWEGNSQEYVGL